MAQKKAATRAVPSTPKRAVSKLIPMPKVSSLATATLPTGYAPLLADLKTRVRSAQLKAAVSVNRELILLYWHLGREILRCQQQQGWGAKVVDRLSVDLRAEFPEMGGLSRSNLLSMRSFAEAYPDEPFVQQLVGQIPWGHNVLLLARVKDPTAREWYARQTVEQGWSRAVLSAQIETQAHARSGQAITNFSRTLPPEKSDLARELLKDPYTFEYALRDLAKPIGVSKWQTQLVDSLPLNLRGTLPSIEDIERELRS